MKFTLLSVLSSLALLTSIFFGADVHLYSVSVEIGEEIKIHPIFWLEMSEDQMYAIGCHGWSFGNVVATTRDGSGAIDCVLPHEIVHSEQWRALGLLTWFAGFMLPLEPPGPYNWSIPETFIEGMWRPPENWENQWSFITFDR